MLPLMLEFAFGFLSSTIHSEVTKLWVAKIFAYCKKNSQQLLHLSQIFAHQNKDMKNLLGVTFPVREKLNIWNRCYKRKTDASEEGKYFSLTELVII